MQFRVEAPGLTVRAVRHASGAIRRHPLPVTVLLGFVFLFAVWVATQLSLVRSIDEVETRASATYIRYVRAEELLATMRAQRLLASIYLRDALLDPEAAAAPESQRQLEEARRQITDALSDYGRLVNSASERDTVEQLRQTMRAYWDTVLPVLDWSSAGRYEEARDLLLRSGAERRDNASRIGDRIRELNRVAFVQQQEDVALAYRTLQHRFWQTSAVALTLGLAIVLAVTVHAGRLDLRVREQLARNAENTRNLQRLSASLVHAEEEGRRMVARELHDEVGQALTAIKLELRSAERRARQAGGLGNVLDAAQGLADDTIQTVRHLSQRLRPSVLDHLGLPEALRSSLREFSDRTGVRTEFSADGVDARFDAALETCLYRIVQEALTNVARHAQASLCRVTLQRSPAALLMTIADNGKGMAEPSLEVDESGRGLGLLGMQERVAGFGGTFRIDTAVGRGTRLMVEVPALPPSQAEADGHAPDSTSIQEEKIS